MSTPPIRCSVDPLQPPATAEDLHRLPDDARYEVINGSLTPRAALFGIEDGTQGGP